MIKVRSDGLDTEAPQFVGCFLAAGGAEHAPARTQQTCDPSAYVAATDDQQTLAA